MQFTLTAWVQTPKARNDCRGNKTYLLSKTRVSETIWPVATC